MDIGLSSGGIGLPIANKNARLKVRNMVSAPRPHSLKFLYALSSREEAKAMVKSPSGTEWDEPMPESSAIILADLLTTPCIVAVAWMNEEKVVGKDGVSPWSP